jgi:hypothetical protein
MSHSKLQTSAYLTTVEIFADCAATSGEVGNRRSDREGREGRAGAQLPNILTLEKVNLTEATKGIDVILSCDVL